MELYYDPKRKKSLAEIQSRHDTRPCWLKGCSPLFLCWLCFFAFCLVCLTFLTLTRRQAHQGAGARLSVYSNGIPCSLAFRSFFWDQDHRIWVCWHRLPGYLILPSGLIGSKSIRMGIFIGHRQLIMCQSETRAGQPRYDTCISPSSSQHQHPSINWVIDQRFRASAELEPLISCRHSSQAAESQMSCQFIFTPVNTTSAGTGSCSQPRPGPLNRSRGCAFHRTIDRQACRTLGTERAHLIHGRL